MLRSEALVYKSFFFFQYSRSTDIIRHKILTNNHCNFSTRQDGVENRDKVYW